MFDIGWSEMAVILMVALIVIGPKDLPRVARTIGKGTGTARGMAREAELQDVKAEIDKLSRVDVRHRIEETIDPAGDLRRTLNAPVAAPLRDDDMDEPDRPEPAPALTAPAALPPPKPAAQPAPAAPAASSEKT